ncbi:helix-turn-helix transcriptional regulator [Listeria booriae]|uniref:Helix-turn-helix transcriptional regulator n=1 Tax=Listeria booriae TaxID=1552123 RepID=A0A842CTC4_9LIST|nr:helix-turn-helix transcriptional regulator [Listeria booriae]MBC2005488.1 helix-turn-helix transcriptional regulator [Listeria booriae]
MALHLKLKEERKRNNWTQDTLAEKVGVSREMIGRWERQEAIPTVSSCIRICKVLNITVDFLIRDDIDSKNNQVKYTTLGKSILDLVDERYPIDFFRKYSIVSKEEVFSIPRKQGLDFLNTVGDEIEKADTEEYDKNLRNYMRQFIFSWYKFNKARFLLAKEQKAIGLEINAILFSQEEIKRELEGVYSEQPIMMLRGLMVKRLENYICDEYNIQRDNLSKDYEFDNEWSKSTYKLID